MKKRLKLILFLTMFTVGFSSCLDNWLENLPEDQVVLDQYWTSASDVESSIGACYRYMIDSKFTYRLFYWGELRSDNIALASPSTDESNIWNVNILADNSITSWDAYYQVINYCNTVIYYAPGVMDKDPNFRQDELNAYMSEALTIRSLCYFYLVRTFGEVPLVLNPSKDDTQNFNVPQNTERQILDQIISDLKLAELNARNSWYSIAQNKGRVTKNAVRALLADVYLWDQKYDLCSQKCDDVLTDTYSVLALMESDYLFTKVFYTGNSTESIFELNFDNSAVSNTMTSTMYGNPNKPSSNGKVKASPSILSAYNSTYDKRANSFQMSEKAGRKIFKYEGQASIENGEDYIYIYRGASSSANWIFYRLSDIYLMKAEALAENSDAESLKTAVTLVNKTYIRANPNTDSLLFTDYSSQNAVRKLVLEERRREFAYEGKRWFDLVRMMRREGSTQNASQYIIPNYTDAVLVTEKLSQPGAWYLPINQSQMSIDTLLVQNEYYKSIFGND